jgi:hypothetical protein
LGVDHQGAATPTASAIAGGFLGCGFGRITKRRFLHVGPMIDLIFHSVAAWKKNPPASPMLPMAINTGGT